MSKRKLTFWQETKALFGGVLTGLWRTSKKPSFGRMVSGAAEDLFNSSSKNRSELKTSKQRTSSPSSSGASTTDELWLNSSGEKVPWVELSEVDQRYHKDDVAQTGCDIDEYADNVRRDEFYDEHVRPYRTDPEE